MRQKFEFPLATVEDGEDTLMKGEFMVILELLSELPGAREGKAKVSSVPRVLNFIDSSGRPGDRPVWSLPQRNRTSGDLLALAERHSYHCPEHAGGHRADQVEVRPGDGGQAGQSRCGRLR